MFPQKMWLDKYLIRLKYRKQTFLKAKPRVFPFKTFSYKECLIKRNTMAKLFNQETSIELYLRKKEPKRSDENGDDFFSWFICDLRISSYDFIEYNFDDSEIILCAGEIKQLIHGIRNIIEKGKHVTKEKLFDFSQPLLRFDFISYEAFFELSFIDNGICDEIPSVVVEFWLNPSAVISEQYETKRGLSFIVDLVIVEKFANDLASEMFASIEADCF